MVIEAGIADRGRLRFRMKTRPTTDPTCRNCAHFVDDPADIEPEFPSVKILGSFYASVRGSAGICRDRDRFMDPIPAADCPAFLPRTRAGDVEPS